MHRPDLSAENSGWQVINPTSSGQNNSVGPSSVVALKANKNDLKWDTEQINDFLHGNRKYWLIDAQGNRKLMSRKKEIRSKHSYKIVKFLLDCRNREKFDKNMDFN